MSPRRPGALDGLGPRTAQLAIALTLALSAFLTGAAAGALTVGTASEVAGGINEGGSAMSWWVQVTFAIDTIPSTLPISASNNSSVPTMLPFANTSFVVGTAASGDVAVRWTFEARSPPTTTEFEETFTFVNASGVSTVISVFLQTPISSPSTPLNYRFFLDIGSSGFTAGEQISQLCASSGSCP